MAEIDIEYDDALRILDSIYRTLLRSTVDTPPRENLQAAYMEVIVLKANCEKFLDLALQIQQKFN